MFRTLVLTLSSLLSLAVVNLSTPAHAFQGKSPKKDSYRKTMKSSAGGDQVYSIDIVEDQVTSIAANDNLRTVLVVSFYTGYSFAADADATSRIGRYTLQRTGTPTKEDGYTLTNWKVVKVEGKDVLKGKYGKTVLMKLKPRRHLILELSAKESHQLNWEDPNYDPYDD